MNKIIVGDALASLKTIPDNSIHCCVTSPPYWGQRIYGSGPEEIGGEYLFQDYVKNLVNVFREVRRVLHPSGSFWLNLADTYSGAMKSSTKDGHAYVGKKQSTNKGSVGNVPIKPERLGGLPVKNLVGMPWKVAFALQDDGWILRRDIIWYKPNVFPESVEDRFTTAHEYIFHFVKSRNYYFDHNAVRVPLAGTNTAPHNLIDPSYYVEDGRNERSVIFMNKPSGREKKGKDFHTATFPPELPMHAIKASTSEHGVCFYCLAPYERETIRLEENKEKRWVTTGWKPTCKCDRQLIPAIVLDPFLGSGTTAQVAEKLGRDCVGIELNKDFVEKISQEK